VLDIGGIVLNRILSEPTEGLEHWSKVKLAYFSAEYAGIYRSIQKFYIKQGNLPCFSELDISVRDPMIKNHVEALRLLEISDDIPTDIAVQALINQYTQSETLSELNNFLDNITMLESEEVKEELSNITFRLEEKTLASEDIILMNNISLMDEEEILSRVPIGLNNTFDLDVGGFALTDYIALGGFRGSGKSIVCSNICKNQIQQGNSTLYFTIEMRAIEVFTRHMSSMSNVPMKHIQQGKVTQEEADRLAKTRADMFTDSEEALIKYNEHKDYNRLENELMHNNKLSLDNQFIIIDDPRLTLASIDLNIQKFKAQFKDKLKVVVVDYLNQIDIPDIYEWKTQIYLSKKLKEFARKHNIIMITPFQIDKSGEVRFSKGIQDSMDISINLDAHKDKENPENSHIKFTSTKTRNYDDFEFYSHTDFTTANISAADFVPIPDEEEQPKKQKKAPEPEATTKVPWDK